MELGEKLRQARVEAGMSQRQLCGDTITRNMLSQIEGGKARPSMATLQYLAARLGKSVGYFLEENTVESDNVGIMAQARAEFARKNHVAALETLAHYCAPDALFDAEYTYLSALCALAAGKEKLESGDALGAAALLEGVDRSSIYYREDMERSRKQLLLHAYAQLEQYYKEREDYQQAYFYACKVRAFSPR